MLASLAFAPSPAAAEPVQDGVLVDGEYEFGYTSASGGMEIHWSVVDQAVVFCLKAHTNGWVAIGLEPTQLMKDADMYFGWYANGTGHAEDAYATGTFGPHPRDTDLGGTFDITGYEVGQKGGWTTFEFRRALDTGDRWDHPVPESGKLDIIWAYGASDDWTLQHMDRGHATIDTGTGDVNVGVRVPGWIPHASLMALGTILLIRGFQIARRKERGWLVHHRRVNTWGTALVVLGLLSSFLLVVYRQTPHLRVPHAWLGLVTLVLVLSTWYLGHTYEGAPSKRRRRLRKPKIWMGRITLVMVLLTVVFGILTVALRL